MESRQKPSQGSLNWDIVGHRSTEMVEIHGSGETCQVVSAPDPHISQPVKLKYLRDVACDWGLIQRLCALKLFDIFIVFDFSPGEPRPLLTGEGRRAEKDRSCLGSCTYYSVLVSQLLSCGWLSVDRLIADRVDSVPSSLVNHR